MCFHIRLLGASVLAEMIIWDFSFAIGIGANLSAVIEKALLAFKVGESDERERANRSMPV